jgi:hypothetical protein
MDRYDIALRPGLGAAVLGFAVLTATILLSLAAPRAANAAEPQFSKNMRILFIGNSYTNANDLPGMMIGMMATKGIKLETRSVIPGGCTLEKHWKGEEARKAIGDGPWDYVVIQEQSQMPAVNPAGTLKYAALLADAVRQANSQPVFYLTWARKDKPEMQAALTATYIKAGTDAKSLVAPAGIAWQDAMTADPKLVLHSADGSHPNVQGTYLTACVFYATLLRRDPTGLPGRLVIDTKVRDNVIMRRNPANLTAAQAKPLQAAAWKTVEQLQSYKPAGSAETQPADVPAGKPAGKTGKKPNAATGGK